MSRLIESLYHLLIWLGCAIGIVKRPLPTPPEVPPSTDDDHRPILQDSLIFYGPFIPQWNSFDFREMVMFDFCYQVHGCGDQAQKYGIKNPVKNGVTFLLSVLNVESGCHESVYQYDGKNVSGLPVSVERLYWVPGVADNYPPPQFAPRRLRPLGCTTTPPVRAPLDPQGDKYTLTLRVKAPNGQSWGWTEVVKVAGNPCK